MINPVYTQQPYLIKPIKQHNKRQNLSFKGNCSFDPTDEAIMQYIETSTPDNKTRETFTNHVANRIKGNIVFSAVNDPKSDHVSKVRVSYTDKKEHPHRHDADEQNIELETTISTLDLLRDVAMTNVYHTTEKPRLLILKGLSEAWRIDYPNSKDPNPFENI